MLAIRKIRTFADRYPWLGPVIWLLNIQYFVTQVMVAAAWPVPYSWSRNAISDLGNTACGQDGTRYVCSPMHLAMNISFLSLGVAMVVGSGLIYQEFRRTPGSGLGFGGMAIAGFGTILVGLFPENTIVQLHSLGAFLTFVVGGLSLIAFAKYLAIPRGLRALALTLGIISLVSLVLFLSKHFLGLGFGGMERLTAYPQTVWLIIFGAYMSMNHYQAGRSHHVANRRN